MTAIAASHVDLQMPDAERRPRIVELLRLGTDIRDGHLQPVRSGRPTSTALRVAERLGLDVRTDESPFETELARLLDDHGRAYCKKVSPRCEQCVLRTFCVNARPPTKPDVRPTVVELFAGAGGLGLGFVHAGYHVLAAFERDRDAAQTYRLNHPGTRVIETDVRLVDADVLSRLGLIEGMVDVLVAGPPCQGYSAAGRRNASDPLNRLFCHVTRIARILRPRVVVIENVLGARGVGGVDFASTIRSSLHRSGYCASEPSALLASQYGVPQNRRRLVFIGRRSDLGGAPPPPPPTHQLKRLRDVTSSLPLGPTVREVLAGLPEYAAGVDAEFAVHDAVVVRNGSTMRHSKTVIEKIRQIEQGKGPLSYRRLPDDVAATLVAGHRAMPVHPWLDRTISVREAARIQGFPDHFVFAGSRANQPLQVANAVPPPLAKAIAKHLRMYLTADEKRAAVLP
jgi:DNA (cytosine-5)-methyltransferase 1